MILPAWVYQQKCTVSRRGVGGNGNPFDKIVTHTLCRIEPQEKTSGSPDGGIIVRRAKGWFPYSTPIKKLDIVTMEDGTKYKVREVYHYPSLVGYSHKEVELGD